MPMVACLSECLLEPCIGVIWLSGISAERAAVLLMLILACLSGMFVPNLRRRDLAVRYSAGSVQLFCSCSCWHV